MTSDEIRETFLSFFAERGHKRLPSASLVPAAFDPSVLLTTAGMHPLKPYFLGIEQPPADKLTSCQKCFRTPDIENVGVTARHLTFFEMLGNFSMGDYFKQGAVEFAWELSLEGFGFKAQDIWITVFEGDPELGIGPDEEAIAAWESVGVPRSRIVALPRSENFWQAGPNGPCGPCSELYLDRGLDFGSEDDLPGGENERFLEFWNLVFMQYDQDPPGTLTPLPAQNIDTGMGLNRMAAILQGVETVFDTDQFAPLMALGKELAQRPDDRGLRILADHTRGMTFLVADGVVPSNEDRGYVLRRLMRRAIQHGHRMGIEPGFLPRYVDVVVETMGAGYPELERERDTILKWVRAEEEGFGRTLETGLGMLDRILEAGEVSGDDAFRLHDTYGFPIDLTEEIAAERGASVDRAGFDANMEAQRVRSSAGAGASKKVGADQELVRQLATEPSRFTGYEHLEERTTVAGVAEQGGRTFVKLATSPFYAQGGGQVSDTGTVACADGDCRATVVEVLRSGEDQAVVVELEEGSLREGEEVVARVDRVARHATQCNHTATHLLHAALRQRLGTHVRQAGSYVGPDKLRFDFTHGQRLSPEELRDVEDQVNAWILRNDPVVPQTTSLDEARAKGAMALFGEKYGDVVRMVEVGDAQSTSSTGTGGIYSRELCGGTHVRSTAEIGVFRVVSEGSSASNVRRIEAVTGPEAVGLLRAHDAIAREAADALRTTPEQLVARIGALRDEAKKAAKAGAGGGNGAVDVDALAGRAEELGGFKVLTASVPVGDAKALLDAADRLKNKLGDAAIVLGAAGEGRVHLVASVAPALVERGVKAGDVVKVAAQVTGGGGGGKPTMAQAGGRDPEKLDDALAAARDAIASALGA
ncbi:alanine--tRNA ligase [Conexibacter sp. SYSU D00693]|uniref:alanine--tRNA ligase n=1 Tax=Conexibacter sp. SYSU D00693 TaxID=2812560 RepID=UPI00196AAD8C|nr:alanine--tRNA ligase [Conexibacter sp. SYSU D00693]